jgi:hypothetical protein
MEEQVYIYTYIYINTYIQRDGVRESALVTPPLLCVFVLPSKTPAFCRLIRCVVFVLVDSQSIMSINTHLYISSITRQNGIAPDACFSINLYLDASRGTEDSMNFCSSTLGCPKCVASMSLYFRSSHLIDVKRNDIHAMRVKRDQIHGM